VELTRVVYYCAATLDGYIAAEDDTIEWLTGYKGTYSAGGGLLDELRVHVVPVVLGQGKPFFDRALPGAPMQLTGVVPRENGMVELTYEIERAQT
jgi:dihydrofolate reductase